MRNMLRHIWLAGILVLIFRVGWADVKPEDQAVFDRVNQLRAAPFARAVAMGYDPTRLWELGLTPETVLPPYVLDEDLCRTAADVNFRAARPDLAGDPPETDRARLFETGTVLVFSNFIPVDTAADFFVQNLFRSELDSGKFRYVLSDTLFYAGASVDAGVVDGRNAWFFSWMVGSAARVRDMQVLNLINQLRAEPSVVFNYISPSQMTLFQRNWQINLLMRISLQPLFSDETLHRYAALNIPGILAPGPDGPLGPFEPPPQYSREFFRFTPVAAFYSDQFTVDPVTYLFAVLLIDELYMWPFSATLLTNRFTLGGASVLPPTAENYGIGRLTLCTAASAEPEPEEPLLSARIYGLVYQDMNNDGIYRAGTEMPGKTVTVYDDTHIPVATVVTDNAGHFDLSLEPGRNWVFAVEEADQIVQSVHFIKKDRFVKLGFQLPIP